MKTRILAVAFLTFTVLLSQPAHAADPLLRARYERTVRKAVAYLATSGRAADGSYSSELGPALTALATTALLRHGRSPDESQVAGSLAYLQTFVQENGGVYRPGTLYRNYETSVAVVCFAAANLDGRYDNTLADAKVFLTGLQWDEDEELNRSDTAYGGAGYGRHGRPDLSNTNYLIDALVAAGDEADSEALERALLFVSRCQNLETSYNTTPFAAKINDGGFYYTPAAGGVSQADMTDGLRSYGSMTYAGLKSMIYAGVGPEDIRVRKAVEWIQKNYRLDQNPGMGAADPKKGEAGLYYYYHTFAKALAAMDLDEVKDTDGKKHDWRAELIEVLADKQQADGSWINSNERWLEGNPNLVTAYALLALSYCRPE